VFQSGSRAVSTADLLQIHAHYALRALLAASSYDDKRGAESSRNIQDQYCDTARGCPSAAKRRRAERGKRVGSVTLPLHPAPAQRASSQPTH
jgi:hypothetical protein